MVDNVPPGVRLAALLALGLTYTVYSIRHQPPGITRLLMSLPVALLFVLAPFQFSESVIVCGSLGFLFGWLANFKLLAFAADRGPLASRGLRAWQWLLLLILPYYSSKRCQPPARPGHVALGLVFKLVLAAALTVLLLSPLADLHRVLRHAGYALYVWVFASLVLDTPLPLGARLLGHLPLQPSMNNPFAATSVRQFWGRRYNQVVSATLKDNVYDPIMEGSWVARRAKSSRDSARESPATDKPTTATATAAGVGVGDGADKAQRQHQDQHQQAGAMTANGVHCNGDSTTTTTITTTTTTMNDISRGGARRRPPASAAVAGRGGGGSYVAAASATAIMATTGAPVCNGSSSSSSSSSYNNSGGHDGGGAAEGGRLLVSEGRRLGAMWAAFAVSGLMHEVAMIYLCGGRLEGTFRMTAMFLLQPPIILAQDAATAALSRVVPERIRSSWVASALQTVVTLALVLASTEELFWGPMETCRTDERGLAEVMGAMRAAGDWCGGLAGRARGLVAGFRVRV